MSAERREVAWESMDRQATIHSYFWAIQRHRWNASTSRKMSFSIWEESHLSLHHITLLFIYFFNKWFPDGSVVKNPSFNAGDSRDTGSILGSGPSPGVGNGNPLQCSCLENSLDRGSWQATVYWVIKRWAPLSTHRIQDSSYATCYFFPININILIQSESTVIHHKFLFWHCPK